MIDQGYNFGSYWNNKPNDGLTAQQGKKKYIMNAKTLVSTYETSALSDAVKQPRFDPYKSPEHRMEYSLYGGEYYCASDVKIYLGDIWVDDAIAIDYTMSEKVTPVYGYASFTYDDIARGQRIVSGSLSINFKSAGYMHNVLKYADAIMYALKVGENKGTVKPHYYDKYKLNELLALLGKKSFAQISAEYEAALWGDINAENANETVLNHDLMPFFPNSNLGFDIRVHFGPVDEVMNNGQYEYYAATYDLQVPEYTVEVINGVQFSAMSKGIATEMQSTPITEAYGFIARDLNGISKDRFVAQLEFENMDEEGTMFGNANSTNVEDVYQDGMNYEKNDYSDEGVNVGTQAGDLVEAKFVSNYDGDTMNLYVKDWGKEVQVRLIGVDSYEMDSKNPKEAAAAQNAKNYLFNVLSEATTIKMEFEKNKDGKVLDKYGRYTAYVYADGQRINTLVAKRGHGKLAYASYGNSRYRTEIQRAEESARLSKKGIWSELPHRPHWDLTDAEIKRFFELAPDLSGGMTPEEWEKEQNK